MLIDKYVYPGTHVLVNKYGVKDAQQLETLERNATLLSIIDIRKRGVTGQFDTDHIRALHKELFEDVYGWAGEFRSIYLYKGGTDFVAPDKIPAALEKLYAEIREQDYFRGLPQRETAGHLADVICRLNDIHPFREGNGRTQRLFTEQLAANAGYELDFSKISDLSLIDASRAGSRGDTRLMTYLLNAAMAPTGHLGPVKNQTKTRDKVSILHQVFPFLAGKDREPTDVPEP